MSLKYSIATLGCKINQVDSAAIGRDMERFGCIRVDFGQRADLIIVNTCAVTARADKQGRQLVAKARSTSPDGLILVTGCSPMTTENHPNAYLKADIVCGNEEKTNIPKLIERRLKTRERIVQVEIAKRSEIVTSADPVPIPERSRAFCKIQDGCSFGCAYCIVPSARGPSRSVSAERAIEQYRYFVDAGFAEIVLTGIHLGCWGLDISSPQRLSSIVKTLTGKFPETRLRLSSIEPPEVEDELVDLLKDRSNLCRHFHIPMQSGSDAILTAMKRKYDAKTFSRIVEQIESVCPETTIGADVIVGFPGESDDDHRKTVRLIKSLPLSHLHVFPFSARPGTPAAKMSGKVEPEKIRQRSREIRRIGLENKNAHYEKFVGKILDVLTESRSSKNIFVGLSDNYIPVHFEQNSLIGRIVKVKIEKRIAQKDQPALFGHVVK